MMSVLLLASLSLHLRRLPALSLHSLSGKDTVLRSSLKCAQDAGIVDAPEATRDSARASAATEETRDSAPAVCPPTVSLADFVVQRAIQQQLYFIAELQKNVHLGKWLAQFEGHEHLESTNRKSGAPGNPGSYSAMFGQLRLPAALYLSALGNAPVEVISVEFSRPRRRLSARELQNPFLVKQAAEAAAEKEFVDVPIVPRQMMARLLTTAHEIADTWAFHLGELEAGDTARVETDWAQKAMPTAAMLRDLQLVQGGETAISWYTADEPLPLHALDHRACDRLVTLRALESLVAEVSALTPENAFGCDYLGLEAESDVVMAGSDDARVVERRRKRKERRQACFAPISDDDRPAAAQNAALLFLQEYAAHWVPKLTKGDERSALEKHAGRPDPGMQERPRPEGCGADADAALEDLWAWMGAPPYHIPGGEMVDPARMGVRLRELRAVHAAEARRELTDEIIAELTRARIEYTDYTEEDERLRIEQKRAEAEAELVWKLDRSMEGLNEG